VLSWTIACLLDRRYLMKNEVDVSELSPFTAVLPPLYIFKRVTITGDQNTAAIVFICFAFYAACANGFSQGIMMDEDKMVSQVKDNYWSNISNVATIDGAKDSGTIGGTIDDAPASLGADGKAKWTAKRDGNVIHVTVTRGDLALRFEETFDGFTFTDIKVTYYSDGTQKVKYDKDGDNTVFKKYIEGLLKKQSGKD
ncbi:MAG: hypothetical protein IJ723_07375, partial [Ruminococcus sp.]|nr:hypothetical protein [Ruminococcus sp.]